MYHTSPKSTWAQIQALVSSSWSWGGPSACTSLPAFLEWGSGTTLYTVSDSPYVFKDSYFIFFPTALLLTDLNVQQYEGAHST